MPRPPSTERVAPLLLCIALLCAPTAANAFWQRPTDVIEGTAYTLPERRLNIGVLGPMSYGVSDRVTLSTHPVLDLLLVLNGAIRWRIVDGPPTVSLAAAYTQSFFVVENTEPEGELRLLALSSIPLGESVIVSASLGAAADLTRNEQAAQIGLGLHVRLGAAGMLHLKGDIQQVYMEDSERTDPGATLLYWRAFERLRVGGGLSYGRFAAAPTVVTVGEERRLVPYLDLVWEF